MVKKEQAHTIGTGACANCGFIHYVNPTVKRTNSGGFQCVVCLNVYEDEVEARNCAINDHTVRLGNVVDMTPEVVA